MQSANAYPARLEIDYPERLGRLTTFFRPIMLIPIAIVLGWLSSSVAVATGLMIVFRRKYPRWWFDFSRELTRFSTRFVAYATLLTDVYPSTTDEQAVHLELDYPDAERDLNRWLPLFKWFLAIPHFILLWFMGLFTIVSVVIAWFAILFTGRYPRPLFDFITGFLRWTLRVQAYAGLFLTDSYPPFSVN
jgi:hypothetical protein